MLEPPALSNDRIAALLAGAYGLVVVSVDFLPLGADVDTAAYRATTAAGTSTFVKLRSGPFDASSVAIPRALADLGIDVVIPPIRGRVRAPFRAA